MIKGTSADYCKCGKKLGKWSKYLACRECRQRKCKNPNCVNKITASTESTGWCQKCHGLKDTKRLLETYEALGGG